MTVKVCAEPEGAPQVVGRRRTARPMDRELRLPTEETTSGQLAPHRRPSAIQVRITILAYDSSYRVVAISVYGRRDLPRVGVGCTL